MEIHALLDATRRVAISAYFHHPGGAKCADRALWNTPKEPITLRAIGTELLAAAALSYRFFHQRMARIRECLEEAVGPLAEAYAVKAIQEGRPARYGLAIEPARIEIVGEGYL